MPVSPAARVGILVFIAAIAFTLVAAFLTGWRLSVSGYPITVIVNDAMGMTKGSEVRMAGVTIGNIKDITLNRHDRAVIVLQINRKYRIPVGSEFLLRIGLLIGDKYIDIIPDRSATKYYKPGAVIQGTVPPRPEDLIPKVNKVLSNLDVTTTNINKLLGSPEFQARLSRALTNLENATARLDKTMALIQGTVAGSQGQVQMIINNVVATSDNLRAFTNELSAFAKSGQMQGNISGTLEAARRSAESLERSTASLEKLATSPELQQDVTQTIKEARATVEEAHKVINRVGGILGVGPTGKPGAPGAVSGAKLNLREPSLEAVFIPDDSSRFRVTGYLTVPQRGNKFLRLGVYDIGETNKGILQLGRSLDKDTDLRYGLYASKLSVGADRVFSPKVYGTANLYDINHPILDLQAGYKVNDDWGLLLGVDKVFRDNQLTIGARFTR